MITVSNDFKTQMKAVSKQLLAYVTDGTDEITELDDLKKLKIYTESSILKTVLRKVEIEHFGTHAYLGEEVNVGLGVDISGTPEYIDYGTFKIYKSEDIKESESVKLTGYDKMYESLIGWDLDPIYDLTYPTTLLGLLQAICTRLGWTLATTTFPNSTQAIPLDVLSNVVKTYREALDYIAEASGSIIYFDVNDELTVAQINKTTSLETLTSIGTGVLNTLTVEPKWGEVNSVVLSRMPQEDNIVDKDDDSITANGETQVKIVNNWIVDSDRETWITSIFSTLFELEMYPFKATTNGLGYFQIGDRITVQDLASNNYETVILGIELEMTGALKETLWAETPDKASTDYNTAGILGQKITNTEIIVNKQQGEIEILNGQMETVATIPRQSEPPESPSVNDLWLDTDDNVIYRWTGSEWEATGLTTEDLTDYYTKDETLAQISLTADTITASVEATQTTANNAQALADANSGDITSIQSQVTQLELDVDGLEVQVEGIGGTNLLKNSVGLKGSIEEWQEFDGNGDLIDSNNDGTVTQTSSVEENTESGSAIRIDEQFIVQTIPTIAGEKYTVYFRFYKYLDCDLIISGVIDPIEITAGSYVDETWALFKYQFTAPGNTTTIKIDNTSGGTGAYCIISDAVCKLGDVVGWVQAPNEVYGKNFKFDKDGFTVTSLTDYFKAVLDNVKLGIYDTSSGTDKIMALFSKDSALLTKLIAQDELVLQRYQNSASSSRFIPTSTGCMITVND